MTIKWWNRTDLKSHFEMCSKHHEPSQMWWRTYARWLIKTDDIHTIQTESSSLKLLSPQKAAYTVLHFCHSFANLKFYMQYFGITHDMLFSALLDGRKIQPRVYRSYTILQTIPEEILEDSAFAWLTWSCEHFSYLPWTFLQTVFKYIPKGQSDFYEAAHLSAFEQRLQTLFDKNAFVALFASINGRAVRRAPLNKDTVYDLLMATCIHQDVDWIVKVAVYLDLHCR